MKAIDFKQRNIIFARNQPQYLPLPAHRASDGTVTSCWKLSFSERLKIALKGKIYLQTLTFNHPPQPLKMLVSKPKEK
uniref:Uncharacterized protein n=1 Tax=viral metagenome TaxID=1070528 RepID=A0A6H1ZCX9_9ZZZZ